MTRHDGRRLGGDPDNAATGRPGSLDDIASDGDSLLGDGTNQGEGVVGDLPEALRFGDVETVERDGDVPPGGEVTLPGHEDDPSWPLGSKPKAP